MLFAGAPPVRQTMENVDDDTPQQVEDPDCGLPNKLGSSARNRASKTFKCRKQAKGEIQTEI